MKKLVKQQKGEVLTDSLIFAEEFKIAHKEVVRKIKNLTVEYPTVRNQFKEDVFTNNRNREYSYYLITRDGYMTLVMNTSAKGESLSLLFEKKQLFIRAFNLMEKEIIKKRNNQKNIEWCKTREQGKQIRNDLTDTIKKFVEYAMKQGSKSAGRYYGNITKMEYKALGIIQEDNKSIRDVLDTLELYQLLLAEDIAKKKFNEYMEQELHYKEIFLLVKQDIIKYASSICIQR